MKSYCENTKNPTTPLSTNDPNFVMKNYVLFLSFRKLVKVYGRHLVELKRLIVILQ